MRLFYYTFAFILCATTTQAQLPCTTTNASGCACPNPGATDCLLLPDITISQDLLLDPLNNPEVPGMLRISTATPNIGFGPLEVSATNFYVCGTDTIESDHPFGVLWQCPNDTNLVARQLIRQVVYEKHGNEMVSSNRWAGSMTYHPTHGHMHVDAWCNFSIRTEVPNTPPLSWPIIAEGSKIGFCLMDFGTCTQYDGYCRTNDNDIMLNSDFPNYGLGGGQFNCGQHQGISVGFVDIYHYYLDDMDIVIPPGTCNGDYMLVVQADPNNNFLEMDETNNVMVSPITLTQQEPISSAIAQAEGEAFICEGTSIVLKSMLEGSSYLWSNGATTPTVEVTTSGAYTLSVTNQCGVAVSSPIDITVLPTIATAISDTICNEGSTMFVVENPIGTLNWYAQPNDTTPIHTGNYFSTPEITTSQTYYLEQTVPYSGAKYYVPPHNNEFGSGGFSSPQYIGSQRFVVSIPCTLTSVKVYPDNSGSTRVFQLRDSLDNVLQEKSVTIPNVYETRVNLNFDLQPGVYYLTTSQAPGLFRNNTNVIYPYTVDGVLSITGSNLDVPASNTYFYYYFYDWEISLPDKTCTSPRTEVQALVLDCTPTNDVIPQASIYIMPNPSPNGYFTVKIDWAGYHQFQFVLRDITGNVVYRQSQSSFQQQLTQPLSLTHLSQGMYWLDLQLDSQHIIRKIALL